MACTISTRLLSAPLVAFPQTEGLGGQCAPWRCPGSQRLVLIFPDWLCALRQPPALSEPQSARWPGYSQRIGLTRRALEGSELHRRGACIRAPSCTHSYPLLSYLLAVHLQVSFSTSLGLHPTHVGWDRYIMPSQVPGSRKQVTGGENIF